MENEQSGQHTAGELQQMKTELLDMVHRAESPYDILAAVARRLERATGERGYADYAQDQIRSVYGLALQEAKPLQDELRDVEERLARIEAARERPEFTEEERTRIGFAAERHKREIERLKLLIRQAEASAPQHA